MTKEPLAVSVKDTCLMLGIGRTKCYELLANNDLAAFRIGRRTLIKMTSIRSLVEGS